jgi:hypothetical protein
MVILPIYLFLYWICHFYMVFIIRKRSNIGINGKRFFLKIFIYRIWLFLLDLLTLYLVDFTNNLYLFNSYPIVFSFSILFYFICRHCLRNQYRYQYVVHIYHPQTIIIYFGHYYLGFLYSISDFVLKFLIIQYLLVIQCVIGMLFLLTLSILDTLFYYNNITDQTGEIFHNLVGYLFNLINNKKD